MSREFIKFAHSFAAENFEENLLNIYLYHLSLSYN